MVYSGIKFLACLFRKSLKFISFLPKILGVSLAHSSILLISGQKSIKGEPGIELALEAILEIEELDSLSDIEPDRDRHSRSRISFESSAMKPRFSLLFEQQLCSSYYCLRILLELALCQCYYYSFGVYCKIANNTYQYPYLLNDQINSYLLQSSFRAPKKIINKIITIITTGKQAHKRKSQKLSHSSVKLPQLKQPSISRGQSKNKMKLHEDSLQVIHQKARNSYSRSLVKARYERYDKEKTRSRAESTRFKTQGVIGQGDDGSPDNSMTALELDNTLRNFQKNVEESRQEMQNEAMRKKLGNKSSLTSIKTAEQSIVQTKKSRLLRKAQKSEDSELFNKIIKIMTKSKTSGCEINLQQIEKTLQHINVVKKIQKFKSETGIGSIDDSLSKEMQSYRNHEKMELKNEDNYTKWRRVSLDPNEKSIQYQESTYENENERLNNLILKTQASLSKYWQNKKLYFQLLQKNEKPPL